MTRTVTSLCLSLIIALAALAGPAQAQTKRAGDTGYLKLGGGLSHYAGDLEDGEPVSFAYVGEVGYQTSPFFSVGLAYQAGRYPRTGTPDPDRFVTQLLGRYTFGAKTWGVAPYLDAGANVAFTGSEVGGGPTVGVGLDIVLSDFASFYVEGRTNLTFPDDAMDETESGTSYDALSQLVGVGFKLNFNAVPTAPRVLAVNGPTDVQTGESVTYSARINQAEATRPVEYRWNFGDGSTGSGLTASHTFAEPGTYTVTFTASNEAGEASQSLTVNATQPASIASINASPNPVDEGEPVQFS
ncbi:MAG: PKD domain-containing protein, partial [Salinibacter sp.]|uniref:PKD domain-containing protein n=1 Tax=Salinibacter sp. TaxID=2065818 RepID=UPI0035D42336